MKKAKDHYLYPIRNKVLNYSGDPFQDFDPVDKQFDDTLSQVLEDIWGYIDKCFEFGDNPLRHLRIYFPNFLCSFHQPKTKTGVAQIVGGVDYVVPRYGDWSMGFVAFTSKVSKDKKKICFCPSEDGLGFWWPYEELAQVNARVLVCGAEQLVDCFEADRLQKKAHS
ncbi:hypothetical protein A2738_01265 [Candidatus Nomurabacteria bacterium RIFCSPHIGHO2_01_FULL_42_15]|uniref:Uncharacterized protein n=1 Tax=Candidatus Nomurabacteria bacterium RIFCSPHIGHO2_01_FULL_42_15 TaxID=1801742 RepID=A0A1F6VFZ5_9BACT|nr:MAG: hypothetical protein A2738_01265 [Candidatus Nomurabacteria bacterium RIFCSPHIGHO2_01_FULL_42_15]OGI93079.1 MAG: hypothetical protein A3A99_00905 [Candidatus Nomurabacteria bacterium RIFCSPLOWO2_01_FULL_41_18]